jgi:hypothetical protein
LPVKTEPSFLAGGGGVLRRFLDEALLCNYCQSTRAALGETLGSSFRIGRWWCSSVVFSLGSIVCGATLDGRGGRWSGFVLHGASTAINVKSCLNGRCYADSSLVWQVLRTTDPPETSSCFLLVLGGMVLWCTSGNHNVL